MIVLDVKKQFLALIDEYAPENTSWTEDEDADMKFKSLLGLAYQSMVDVVPIIKTKEIEHTYSNTEGYTEYNLPTMQLLKRVIALDKENNRITGDYYFVGEKKIYLKNNIEAKYIIEYQANPTIITDDIDDDFELEIPIKAQGKLAYKIADDYLKTDPSANYSAFANEYQRQMQNFDTRTKGILVEIDEGEL